MHRIACVPRQVPKESGIYFVLDQDHCMKYVGCAVNLRQRLTSHEKIAKSDFIAWVLIPERDLPFTEAYYIGLLCPYLNFQGDSIASTRKYKQPNSKQSRLQKRYKKILDERMPGWQTMPLLP